MPNCPPSVFSPRSLCPQFFLKATAALLNNGTFFYGNPIFSKFSYLAHLAMIARPPKNPPRAS